jgi:hypothetical protein
MELHTIGMDLGKTVFHLVGLNLRGEVVVREKFSALATARPETSDSPINARAPNRRLYIVDFDAPSTQALVCTSLRETQACGNIGIGF